MLVVLSLLLACSGEPATNATPATATNAVPKNASNAVDTSKLSEALKLADAADGNEDKVAHKCAGCALSMDGSPDHAVEIDGVTLHLCSAMCKSYFSKDIAGNVIKLLQ